MVLRPYQARDLAGVGRVWEECRICGDTLYRPFDEGYFTEKFIKTDCYEPELVTVAEEDGRLLGFTAGCRKHSFLNNETESNTPGYLTTIMVLPQYRHRGIGSALLSALEDALRKLGKASIDVSSLNPIDLHWLIPGTPAHEHNNMPGVDENSDAYGFLKAQGYRDTVHEVAMYLSLDGWHKSALVDQKRTELAAQGIRAGLYDPAERCEWDTMCDRVGSEYWRKVLKDELSSPAPRPILAARHDGHIVGFTGPVDVESSGRGWFTGICTDPVYEKRGIATVLFNDLMEQFVNVGAKYSSLFTGTENHAQRLYIKTGFRPARHFAMLRKAL
ncbi:MAG: GNAT family N-acetyltransferase [Clostridia bacterium]|nr:GNAT family N-acetyltransferase [Clostridia bacterium]